MNRFSITTSSKPKEAFQNHAQAALHIPAIDFNDHHHSGRIRSTENNTQCFSRKNEITNDEPEIIVYIISHVQVSQIQKIKSKYGTGTWNPDRMTAFQSQ